MYDFHDPYVIHKKYGNNAQLLLTDTDLLCYKLKTKDSCQDMFNNKDLFYLADTQADNPMIGKFKMN